MKKGHTSGKSEYPLSFPKQRTEWPSSEEDQTHSSEDPNVRNSAMALPEFDFIPSFISGKDDNLPSHLGSIKQLYCSTGYNLALDSDGKVYGTREHFHEEATLELTSEEYGEVRIKGVQSGLYIAMDQRGRLYGEADGKSDAVIFKEQFNDGYNTYLSKVYESELWFIAIKKNGKPKRGDKTALGQKATQFIPRQARHT